MIKFREHRGSLDESMETVKEFASEGEFLKYVYDLWYDKEKVRIEHIALEYIGLDTRIDWETWNVVVYYGYYDTEGSYVDANLVAGQVTGFNRLDDSNYPTITEFKKELGDLDYLITKKQLSLPVLYKIIDVFQNPRYVHVREELFDYIYNSIYRIGWRESKKDSLGKFEVFLR